MNRRTLLKALVIVPFVPSILKAVERLRGNPLGPEKRTPRYFRIRAMIPEVRFVKIGDMAETQPSHWIEYSDHPDGPFSRQTECNVKQVGQDDSGIQIKVQCLTPSP
jgi:hypothetical protein